MQPLKIGDKVEDLIDGKIGYVIGITEWKEWGSLSKENHGTIDVESVNFDGDSEFEFYPYFEWQNNLKIIK